MNKISIRFFNDREVRAVWNENNELVSATNQLKLLANDGKRYLTNTLDKE